LKQELQKSPAGTRQTYGKNLVWFEEIERKLAKLSKTTFTDRSSSSLFYAQVFKSFTKMNMTGFSLACPFDALNYVRPRKYVLRLSRKNFISLIWSNALALAQMNL
jgi:hypothetical protein